MRILVSFDLQTPYVNTYFDLTQDLFLHQHSQENTWFRIDQEPSQFDSLFTKDELLISDIKYEHHIGKSDHIVLILTIMVVI